MVSGEVYRFSVTNPRVVFQSYYFEVYWIRRAIFFSEVAWKCECQYFVYLRQFRYCIPQKESFSIWDTFWRSPCCNFSCRRLFPGFRVKLFNLDPNEKYCVFADIVRIDDNRYKYQNSIWKVAGSADGNIPRRFYLHPKSPADGKTWMESVVSFHKLKITNSLRNSRDEKVSCFAWKGSGFISAIYFVPNFYEKRDTPQKGRLLIFERVFVCQLASV